MRAVLDTSVLVDPLPRPIDGDVGISTVSLAELHFGVLLAKTGEQRALRLRRLAGIERAFQPLPVDDAVARAYGKLAATAVGTGRKVRPRALDIMIAATAYVHDARLYTRNPGDLTGLEDLVDVVAVQQDGEEPAADVTVGNVDRWVVKRLKYSAMLNDRSFEAEVRAILTAAMREG